MRISRFSTLIVGVLAAFSWLAVSNAQTAPDLRLWFDSPATNFTQSLPLGNGRLGAMIFGGVTTERIQLNEDSLWSGAPQDADNPKALEALPSSEARAWLQSMLSRLAVRAA